MGGERLGEECIVVKREEALGEGCGALCSLLRAREREAWYEYKSLMRRYIALILSTSKALIDVLKGLKRLLQYPANSGIPTCCCSTFVLILLCCRKDLGLYHQILSTYLA